MSINKLLITIGSVCALLYVMITWMSFGLPLEVCHFLNTLTFNLSSETFLELQNGFHYDNPNNDMPTGIYLFIFFIIFVLVFYAFKKVEHAAFNQKTLLIIIVFSILFRLLSFWGTMIHENDIYRYMWDGKTALAGINPFKYAPSDLFLYDNDIDYDYYDATHDVTLKFTNWDERSKAELGQLLVLRDQDQTLYNRIGHWQVPTIYPPVAQILFAVPMLAAPGSDIVMRAFFMLFDIGVIFLIIALLKTFDCNPLWVILYGWMPLVVIQLTHSGHYDAIVIFLMMLSLYLYIKGRENMACMVLALATLSKFFPAVLFLFMFRKDFIRKGILFTAVIALFYIPFFLWGSTGIAGVFEGFMTYNRDWSYHASIFDIVYYTLEVISTDWVKDLYPAKVIVGLMYLGVIAFLFFKQNHRSHALSLIQNCFFAIATLFILNPVADPWYYCWVMPFLCIFRYRSWILLSGLLMLSYLNFHTDIPWTQVRFLNLKLIVWLTYLPFFILLGSEFLNRYFRTR